MVEDRTSDDSLLLFSSENKENIPPTKEHDGCSSASNDDSAETSMDCRQLIPPDDIIHEAASALISLISRK